MKPHILILSILPLLWGCGSAPDKPSTEKPGPVATQSVQVDTAGITYELVNNKDANGSGNYDVYIKDTTQIQRLNKYLVGYFKGYGDRSMLINYFSDRDAAKEYFIKQMDDQVPEKEKDRLFKYYIARYNLNPGSGYDSLTFEH